MVLLEIKIRLQNNNIIRRRIPEPAITSFRLDERLHDIRTIGETIFAIEDVLHSGIEIKEFEIPLHNQSSQITLLLEQALYFLFGKSITVVSKSTNLQSLLSHEKIELDDAYTSLF